MSFFVSEAPCESTRLVLPRGAPPSTSDALLSPIHFIQASIPFCLCSGVEFCIIRSKSAALAMYRTRNFFIGSFSTRRARGKSEAEGHTRSSHRRPPRNAECLRARFSNRIPLHGQLLGSTLRAAEGTRAEGLCGPRAEANRASGLAGA